MSFSEGECSRDTQATPERQLKRRRRMTTRGSAEPDILRIHIVMAVQTAMLAGMPYTGLRDAIIAHPTMAEALGALFSNVPARSA